MVSEQPKVSPTGRYSTKQVCELLGIHRNTLRVYTLNGAIRCVVRRESMRKFYTGTEILRFWNSVIAL